MQIEGYAGICACCFNPIKKGRNLIFVPKGRQFHRDCVDRYPNSYYVKLER